MTLIEGVGDEVTDFFIIVGILLISWVAWCSTSISDQPLIRTVLILHQRTRTRIAELRSNQAVSLHSNIELTEPSGQMNTNNTSEADISCPESSDSSNNVSIESTTTSAAVASEEMLIEAMDSSNNENSRLLQRRQSNPSDDITNVSEPDQNITTEQTVEDTTEKEDDKISIKLKFINDDQKLVTASPKEALGDFKRRNFQMELESHKMIRLVFKGHILQPDNLTLERCGLYNNCVVHCLVLQQRPSPANTSSSSIESSSTLYFNPQDIPANTTPNAVQNEWDLSRLLVGVLILILGLAWYSRFHYAQLFTATTTIALYALTAVFTVSLFSHFFPDQDSIRNIE